MNFKKYAFYLICCSFICESTAIPPVLAALGILAAGFLYKMNTSIEQCSESWISLNASVLKDALDHRLYGQHLVNSTVTSHLKGHMLLRNPSRALVFSFHGGTGIGKNYVSRIIAESIYRMGMKSKYVHLISAAREFQDKDKVPSYKEMLRDLIENHVKQCGRSLFIFDKFDKMPPGLLDVVNPYLENYEQLNGVDYRKAIFIFISNVGSPLIFDTTLKYLRNGVPRESITLKHIESIIGKAAQETENRGLFQSHVLSKHHVTAFIPFLPLEIHHVRKCIRDSLIAKEHYKQKRRIPDLVVRRINGELTYIPRDAELFSKTGCRKLADKVDFVMLNKDF